MEVDQAMARRECWARRPCGRRGGPSMTPWPNSQTNMICTGKIVDNNLELITVMQQPNRVVDSFKSWTKVCPGLVACRVVTHRAFGDRSMHDVAR